MKFAPLAMAGLAAGLFCGTAAAQTQVALYGLVDACLTRSDTGTATQTSLNSGCRAGSRFGLRGTEDLGGGSSAYFVLENGFNTDTGALGQGGRMFGRKAYVGISSDRYGSLELGRDYAPAFYALSPVDPMQLGVGTISSSMWTGSNPTTVARNDNAINYLSPAMGPVTVRAQYSFGEQDLPAARSGRNTFGVNAIYRSAAWLATMAYARHNNAANTASDKAFTTALSHTAGALTISGALQLGRWEGSRTAAAPSSATSIFSRDYRSYMLGGAYQVLPALKVALSFKRYDDRTAANFDANQLTLMTQYALSKRTDVYAAYSRLKNVSASSYAVVDATNTYSGVAPMAATSLLAVGIRHAF